MAKVNCVDNKQEPDWIAVYAALVGDEEQQIK